MVHSTVASFFEQTQMFRNQNPQPPVSTNQRSSDLFSLDMYYNQSLMKAISANVSRSK